MFISIQVRQGLGQGSPDLLTGNYKHQEVWIHGDIECKQEWMIMHANSECNIHKTGTHACVWNKLPHWRPSMKTYVMHEITVKWKQKLKQFFYKLIYFKMTMGVQKNQEKNNRRKRNMKSDRRVANDMKSRLTLKQMSWMCRRLLDVLWDVWDPRLMLRMSYALLNK